VDLNRYPDLNLRDVKAVIFDFDGVHTNNKVIVSEDGRESVICDRSDGYGIKLLKELGLLLAIISLEKNNVVQARARKLDIPCFNGVEDKLSLLKHELAKASIDFLHTAYVGNDVNDIECLLAVKYSFCVSDAHPDVKKISRYVLQNSGGNGAVRELCDIILAHKKVGLELAF